MTTTTTTRAEPLSSADLEDLGVDPPRDFVEAYRNDEDTITVMVPDPYGGSWLDPPNEDHSGEDAWEWIAFDNGRQREGWLAENQVCAACGIELAAYWNGDDHLWLDSDYEWGYDADEAAEIERWSHCPASGADPQVHQPTLRPTDFLIERYEHSLVRYAPIGEASQVDRQWDVAFGVAVFRFTKPETFYDGDPTREQLLDIVRAVCDEYTSWCNGDVYDLIRYERRRPLDAPHCPVLIPDEFTHDVWEQADSCGGFVGYDYAEETAKTGDW